MTPKIQDVKQKFFYYNFTTKNDCFYALATLYSLRGIFVTCKSIGHGINNVKIEYIHRYMMGSGS